MLDYFTYKEYISEQMTDWQSDRTLEILPFHKTNTGINILSRTVYDLQIMYEQLTYVLIHIRPV